ncbi:MAG: hypothetical protein MH252_06675 [Thermosynechococcaceae cyanobacterium MS004]|nr:hypothetical protein [Thermosynechococcaceae cyanobacterium MS004]
MEIIAKKKRQPVEAPPTAPIAAPLEKEESFTHSVTVQCNTLLYTTLQNMIASAHTGNDFTYTSVADVIRASLQAYKDGMELTELEGSGTKKQTSIRLSAELYEFYKTWPSQLRTKILERVIRTYLSNQA